MSVRLTTTVLAMVCVAGVGVATAELKRAAPKNVDLSGLWKQNPELSDDPQKVLAEKRSQSTSRGPAVGRRGGGVTIDPGDIFGGGTLGGVTIGRGGTVGRSGGSGRDRPADDPEPSDPKRVPLDSFLA